MAQTYTDYDPDRELERLYASITGRAAYSYTPSRDPLYRSYADRYVQNGRMAMRDTVGQGAALTGGYASSYAQSAGQQQYGEYLRALGEALPELYGKALERYRAEGERMRDSYELARERSETAYARERDALADQRYESEQSLAEQQRQQKLRDENYTRLYRLVSTAGYVPSDEELEASGLSRAQAEALRAEYLRTHKQSAAAGGGSGGGSKSSKSSRSGSGTANTAVGSIAKSREKAGLLTANLVETIRKAAVKSGGGGR